MSESQVRQLGINAKNGAVYWAVFQRIPGAPIVSGSHYGTRVDCAAECDGLHGHVWSSEAGARARLAILPANYSRDGVAGAGAPIAREVGRVLHRVGGYFYDVTATAAADLRPGMRVNVGTIGGGDFWQTIDSIELSQRLARMDVYRVTWREVVATDPNAAPSRLSSRRSYDVVTMGC